MSDYELIIVALVMIMVYVILTSAGVHLNWQGNLAGDMLVGIFSAYINIGKS